jgi:hypothetical protein
MRKTVSKRLAYINLYLFASVLTTMGILFLVFPGQKISDVEKRRLCEFPRFSETSFFSGIFMDSLDLFVADQFPMREDFVTINFALADHRGIRDEKVKFYQASDLKKIAPSLTVGKSDSISDSTLASSTAAADSSGDGGDIVSNMLIYNGMAIQFFGGNNKMAKAYADVINKYQAALSGKCTIYDVVVPSTADLYMPDEYRHQSASEKKNIDAIYSNLDPGIKSVDAYTPMMAHRDEYLFFNTDHHWTGTGAYYAYSAFCATAGMTPVQFSQCERKVKKNWLGSLYLLCRDERLHANPDSAVYYKVPGNYKTWRYVDTDIDKGIPTTLYAEHGAGYGVFLGGDFPLLKVETDKHTGRSVCIIKNSFGNAFSPWFVYNFDKVYVIDYRYFNHSLVDFVTKNGITDLVFLNNSFSANTSWHIHRIEKLLKGGSPIVPKQDSVKIKSPADTTRRKAGDSLKPKN